MYDYNSKSYPDPATLRLIGRSADHDYYIKGTRVISYGKTARGTRTTMFGDLDYWRLMLTYCGFRSGLNFVATEYLPRAAVRIRNAAFALLAALEELVAEWDTTHADEDQRSGYTPLTGGMIMACDAIAKAREG